MATAVDELTAEITRLEFSNIRDAAVYKSLTEQLSTIRSNYTVWPAKLRDDVDQLSKSIFTITVFGRTMAGKSTMMEVLTRGDGSSIGHGAQRTTRRDVSLLMNCGKDLSSTMYGMKRIDDDVFIFVTYHKEQADDDKNYVDGKPDYADVFDDNMIFRWDSQIGKGVNSSYMQDVITAKRKHLFVKKSDAESNFYYMGQFEIVHVEEAQKENNKGKKEAISKVQVKMHHPVRDDLLRYLQSGITIEENAV